MDRSEMEDLLNEEWRPIREALEEIGLRERRYPTGSAAGFAIVAVVALAMGVAIGFTLGRLVP